MKTIKELEEKLNSAGLGNYFDKMKKYAKNSIRFNLESTAEDNIAIGSSKMGGLPDLPKNADWFIQEDTGLPMSFICQINFKEIKEFDLDKKLPESGILYLFYDCTPEGMPWGYDPNDAKGKRVYFFDGDIKELERKEAPALLEEDYLFGCAKLSFYNQFELPDYYSNYGEEFELSEEERDKYWDLCDLEEMTINKILGHSNNIQGEMELECELVTNGIYCGSPEGYKSEKAKELAKNYKHWNLLLQIDSNDEANMMWGDVGRIYLWITDEDLKNKNFENSWLILQCG